MRNLLWMLALAVVAACESAPAPAGPVAADADASQRTFGMNLKLSEGGVLKADLYADTAFAKAGTPDVTEIRGVKLTFFDQAPGKKPGKLTSKSGEYDQRTQVMIARGNVVLITQNDRGEERVVRSEELYYDQRGDRVWSERETTVTEPGKSFTSDGFTSDTRFTNVRGKNAKTQGIQVNQTGGSL